MTNQRSSSRRLAHAVAALGVAALGSAGCAGATVGTGPATSFPSPRERLDALVAEPPFDRVHWGVLAVDAQSGEPVYELNPDLLFIPASNMKLPVTVAALGLLGPDYRWQTTFFARSLPFDGRLDGDLYLPAAGDPTLGEPFHPSGEDALGAIADSLLHAGAAEISGRLVVDASAWDSISVAESWMVEDLPVTAGATGGAFAVDRGVLEIRIRGAARAGEPAMAEWTPRGRDAGEPSPFVVSRVVTAPAGETADLVTSYRPESRRWLVEGRIGAGQELTLRRAARDPVRLAVSTLERVLADRGIRSGDGAEILWDRAVPLGRRCESGRIASCAEMLRIAGVPSPPLHEVVAAILGPSQNWMAEQLVRTLGEENGARGSWAEGFRVMGEHLERVAGIGAEDVNWEDGSGLSNHNLISPRALVSLLRHARREPWGELFRAGLAQPGLEGTTLASRLEGLEGRVFAKTGSLSHVNALSGYLVTSGGREIVFAILTNGANLPARDVRGRIDALVGALAAGAAR